MTTNETPEPSFRVVTVCYANLCRSPLMEFILRQLADSHALNWQVSSVGTEARNGMSMHRHASRILARRGLDPTQFLSRRLDGNLLAEADLILTATEATRDSALRVRPEAHRRTFTLLHFAHLLRGLDPYEESEGYGRWLLSQAHRARAQLQPMPVDARDIADPMGHSMARFRRCGRVIEEALEIILEPLPGPRWSWRVGR